MMSYNASHYKHCHKHKRCCKHCRPRRGSLSAPVCLFTFSVIYSYRFCTHNSSDSY